MPPCRRAHGSPVRRPPPRASCATAGSRTRSVLGRPPAGRREARGPSRQHSARNNCADASRSSRRSRTRPPGPPPRSELCSSSNAPPPSRPGRSMERCTASRAPQIFARRSIVLAAARWVPSESSRAAVWVRESQDFAGEGFAAPRRAAIFHATSRCTHIDARAADLQAQVWHVTGGPIQNRDPANAPGGPGFRVRSPGGHRPDPPPPRNVAGDGHFS